MKNLFVSFSVIMSMFAFYSFLVPVEFNSHEKEDSGTFLTQIPYNNIGVLCNDEFLILKGLWKFETSIDEDGNGGYHIESNITLKGSGVGDLGNKYKLDFNKKLIFDIAAEELPYESKNSTTLGIICKGKGPNLKEDVKYNLKINKDGEVTANVIKGKLICRENVSS